MSDVLQSVLDGAVEILRCAQDDEFGGAGVERLMMPEGGQGSRVARNEMALGRGVGFAGASRRAPTVVAACLGLRVVLSCPHVWGPNWTVAL